jgi:SUMO ligase MMS21 Smc5/6 complex component
VDNDDDDIEIEGEHISLKCPLTLLPFTDPVTSKKCPHSFERNAILPMIQNSEARIGGVRRGDGERAVKCPICEQVRSEFRTPFRWRKSR